MQEESERKRSRLGIIVSLFLLRGPLGLTMLWKSEAFDRREKIALTVTVAVYSLVLVAAFYFAARLISRSFTL